MLVPPALSDSRRPGLVCSSAGLMFDRVCYFFFDKAISDFLHPMVVLATTSIQGLKVLDGLLLARFSKECIIPRVLVCGSGQRKMVLLFAYRRLLDNTY